MPAPRGRPPKPEGALTPAERKRAQRERDYAQLWAPGNFVFDWLTLTALVEAIPALIRDERPGMLSKVLVEIGRRGGVAVGARPSGNAGKRIKA